MKNVPNLRFKEFSGEWESLKISETLKIKHGREQKKIQVNDGRYPILATGGEIGRTNTPLYDKESVLIGRKGTIDKPMYMNNPFWTVDTLFYSEIKNNMVPKFIFYKFQNIHWRKYCEASGVPSLSASTIEGIKYNIPKLEEQEKIATFFSLIDKKIELQTEKVEELKNYKKGLLQKIFSQELRFKDENGNEYPEWESIILSKVLWERKEYAEKDGKYPHVTLSKDGIYAKGEQYDRDFLVKKEDKKYKITHEGDICYNPANLKFGVICRNDFGDAIFSPIYVTFEINKNIDSNYMGYYLTRWDFINKVRKYEEGTVYERMAVKPEDFLRFRVDLPNIVEQKKISELFMRVDEKIEKEQEKLEQLQEYKKGLLQQMFI